MCGIAGIIRPEKRGQEALDQMLDRIIHRGPDDSGTYVDASIALGMRRLSIIDVAGGKQPISSEDGSLIIVFNGEIYNFKELRRGLVARNHLFKTDSDTEVILHLYEEYGPAAVRKLRGMFTFFIYDMKKGKIFVARDPFGIKPLYYLEENGAKRAFASEIKSLLAYPGYQKEINEEAMYQYLSFQYNPLRETFFRGIYRLPPATTLLIDASTGEAEEQVYWDYEFQEDAEMEEHSATEKLESLLKDSVEHHLLSDVPLGAFLSGGIDSALIVGAIRAIHPTGELRTFTIGSKEINEFNEAREQSDALHTTHTEIVLDPDEYFALLPRIAWHFDEPVADPAAIALYFLAREARKHVKVVLSGEGADELFGGYGIYREPYSFARFEKSVPRALRSLLLFFARVPVPVRGMNFLRRYRKPLADRYIGNAYIFSDAEARRIWRGKPHARMNLKPLYENVKMLSEPTQMQYIDMHTWLPGDILAKADKMTMAHSLELRVPFLDMKVANFARMIPDALRYKDGTVGNAKYLLRKAAKAFVPPTTQRRTKLGFPIPLAEWLRNRSDWQEKLLTHPFLKKYFDMELVQELARDHISGARNNARKIFIFMMLAAWYDAYFTDALTRIQ
ncbi:asparagine synthase (glutamine-hydrolyzing) [Patescibacteria group bacterium]|nr:asparagine synthase (glutamine-hydrolyzing) [Patescibacteria group bacterium]